MFDFCRQKGILLFGLHPNATHLIQPCDVGIFGPVKKSWRKVVRKHNQSTTAPVTTMNFAPIFKKAYDNAVNATTIINAFRACGLYPINADAVDYSKCINTRRQEMTVHPTSENDDNEEKKDDMRSTMKVIEAEVGQVIRNEFVTSHNTNKQHAHPYFSLWYKCKAKIDNKNVNRENTTVHEHPLDLSNSKSSVDGSLLSLNQETDRVMQLECDSNSVPENESAIQVTDVVVQIHNIADDSTIQINDKNARNESASLICIDSDLFGNSIHQRDFENTDDVIEYMVERDITH